MSTRVRPPKKKKEVRAWQRMLSGRRLDLLDPSPLDVEIVDIAHGLARVARWNGQTEGDHAFSVAQHSVLVTRIFQRQNETATREDLMMTLLHDAPEYVVGDMISPFKAVIGDDYKAVEDRLLAAIHLRFGLKPKPTLKLKKAIKRADMIAAFFEATELAGFERGEAAKLFGLPRGHVSADYDLAPWAVSHAQNAFLSAFEQLEKGTRLQ